MNFVLCLLFSIYLLVWLHQQTTHKWLQVIFYEAESIWNMNIYYMVCSYSLGIIFFKRTTCNFNRRYRFNCKWNWLAFEMVCSRFAHVLKGLLSKYWLYHYLFITKIWRTNEESFATKYAAHIFGSNDDDDDVDNDDHCNFFLVNVPSVLAVRITSKSIQLGFYDVAQSCTKQNAERLKTWSIHPLRLLFEMFLFQDILLCFVEYVLIYLIDVVLNNFIQKLN